MFCVFTAAAAGTLTVQKEAAKTDEDHEDGDELEEAEDKGKTEDAETKETGLYQTAVVVQRIHKCIQYCF